MAYINQKMKADIKTRVRKVFREYNVKGSMKIWKNAYLFITINSGKINFFGSTKGDNQGFMHSNGAGTLSVDERYIDRDFSGVAAECLKKISSAVRFAECGSAQDEDPFITLIRVGKSDRPYIHMM